MGKRKGNTTTQYDARVAAPPHEPNLRWESLWDPMGPSVGRTNNPIWMALQRGEEQAAGAPPPHAGGG
eukprot:8901165-Pyramimonas_sp.AAC.1